MSTNVSSVTKHFPKAQNGFQTTLASTISSGAATVPLNSVAGYTNGDTAVFVVDPTDATKKQTFTGVVDTAGVQITGVVWTAGDNVAHSGGATVVDYVTATHISMTSKGMLTEHNPEGTHGAITATGLTVTGPTVLNGSWDGWVGANETWTYASSTTITVPTDATTKYDIGDYVKITQSAAVKIFIVTAVTSTVLTVTGLAGVTVANSAITANAYSKARSPHSGGLNGGIPYNPYKFSVYRNAAQDTSGGVLLCDTKTFDTSSNVDVVTNKGRFTVPVTGYYQLNASIALVITASPQDPTVGFQKNGATVLPGRFHIINTYAGSSTVYGSVSCFVPLTAGDYVTVFLGSLQTLSIDTSATAYNTFSGFLVSAA